MFITSLLNFILNIVMLDLNNIKENPRDIINILSYETYTLLASTDIILKFRNINIYTTYSI